MPLRRHDAGRDTDPLVCEIGVIGGGPAGAASARRLALLGHRVCLVERHAFPRAHIGESLPPSILPVLESLGLRPRVEQAGFLRPGAAVVRWAGATTTRAYPADAPGFQVDRGRFDALLLDAARAAGVRVLQPVRARRPRPSGDGWIVPLQGAVPYPAVRCRFLVDAAGKHANLPRCRRRYTPLTVALYGYWRTPNLTGTETRVEAGDEAWYWGAPLPDGSVNAAVFLDGSQCAGLDTARRQSRYLSLLAASELLKGCLHGRLLGPVRVCDAACYLDADPIDSASVKVGEAGFSIDPLSSQGVQSALVSALQASIAVHTLLTCPEHGRLAMAFYRDRQQEAVAQHRQFSTGFYAARDHYRPSPFWSARGAGNVVVPTQPPIPTAGLTRSRCLRLAAAARIVPVPVIENDRVVPGLALAHPGLERPVAFLANVALVPLLQQTPWGHTAAEIVGHWSHHGPPQRGLDILRWLWARGVVVPA